MKAKTYYMRPAALQAHAKRGSLSIGEEIALKVIKQSDVEKLVKRAAKALAKQRCAPCNVADSWDGYLPEARAMFRAIGLLP